MSKQLYTTQTLFNYASNDANYDLFISKIEEYDLKNKESEFIVYGTRTRNKKFEQIEVKKFRSLKESVEFCLKDKVEVEVYEERLRFCIKVVETDSVTEFVIKKLQIQGIKRIFNGFPIDYRLTASPYSINIEL